MSKIIESPGHAFIGLFPFERLLPFVFIVLLLPSCATQMSLEEAKKVTVSISGTSAFAPPPRRIDDITSILEQPGQFDRKITERLIVQADAVPPKDADSSFYHKRAEAARQLGRPRQALDDLNRALLLSEKEGAGNPRILLHLALVERDIGNFGRALELMEESLRLARLSSTYRALVETYIQVGDIEKARKTADSAKAFCSAPSRRRSADFYLWCDINALSTEAALLETQAKYAEAEKYIREQHQKISQNIKEDFPAWLINVRLWLAMNLMRQERFMEAELEAREALKESLGHAGKDSLKTAAALGRLANILRAEGRLPEAEKLALLTVQSFEASGISGDSRSMSNTRMLLGSVLSSQGKFTEAMQQFDIALKGAKDDQYAYRKNFLGNHNFMLSLLMTGRNKEALTISTNSYTKAVERFGEEHYITTERLAFRGMANYRLKNLKNAVKDLSKATDILLRFQMDKADYSRIQRLKIIMDDYISLLGEIYGTPVERELGIDAAGIAFKIADAARGHTVQGALAASSARTAETNPELNDLIRREQDALKQTEVIEANVLDLIAAPSAEQKPEIIKDLQVRIVSLNRARAALQEEIKKRFPKYADFVNPKAVSWSQAQKTLHPGEALISIYSTNNGTYTWAIPYRGGLSFLVSPLGTREMGKIVAGLRKSLDPNPATISDIPEFDTASAYDLYHKLLKPIEGGWQNATDLLIVTHSPLDQIPIAILPTANVNPGKDAGLLFSRYRHVPWLIRKASITMLPSVSSLITIRALPAGDPHRRAFVGFGDPVFSPEESVSTTNRKNLQGPVSLASRGSPIQVRGIRLTEKGGLDNAAITTTHLDKLNRLPDTAEEIRSVARAVDADPERDVFLGKDASEDRVKTMNLSDRKIISFATHALVAGDLDGLDQPALALSSPSVTGDKEDGLLTMGEIMKLKLNADWVVLSACNTAAAEGTGAEALSGLGRAFFYAGTRAILASIYPVETTSARKLITALFQYQKEDKELSRARALQKSMLDLMDKSNLVDDASGKIVASYAHPLFWAPFVIVGDGGGGWLQ